MTGFDLPLLVNTVIVAFAVLGGVMASHSGGMALFALVTEQTREELAYRVNRGLGLGFRDGTFAAAVAVTISIAL